MIIGKVIGNYAYYNAPKDNQLKKYFNPRISLSKMTVRIKKPDGELFNFGSHILDHSNISDIYSNSGKIPQDINEIDNNNIDSIAKEQSNENKVIDRLQIDSNITLLFKINCLQRSLDTMFLNKRDS